MSWNVLPVVLVTALFGCEAEPVAPIDAHPIARLPSACFLAVGWGGDVSYDELNLPVAFRPEVTRGLMERPGAAGMLAGTGKYFAVRRGTEQPPDRARGYAYVAEDGWLEARPVPLPAGLLDEPRLAESAWAKRLLGVLAPADAGWTLIVDLRRLRRQSVAVLEDARMSEMLRMLPGLQSFLYAGVHVQRGRKAATADFDGFVRLARTPVGLAKALAAEPGRLRLPSLFEPDKTRGFVVQRGEAGVLVDSLQLAMAGTGAGLFGPGPADVFRAFRSGFLFRRDLWASFDVEWALVDHDGGPVLLATLRDRDALARIANELASESSELLEVETEEHDGALEVRVRALRRRGVAVIGDAFAAFGTDNSLEYLRRLARRERTAGLRPVPPPALGFADAPKKLLGVARLSRAGVGRARWWIGREADGFRVRGTIER